MSIEIEQWRAIPGFEGFYEASDQGGVRSLARLVHRPNKRPYRISGRMKQQHLDANGYLRLSLSKEGRDTKHLAHRIIALTFIGPSLFEGAYVCHMDGNPGNNRVDNLYWGTGSENQADSVRHGTHACASKAECPRGHPYNDVNTYVFVDGEGKTHRICRPCRPLINARYRAKKAGAAA